MGAAIRPARFWCWPRLQLGQLSPTTGDCKRPNGSAENPARAAQKNSRCAEEVAPLSSWNLHSQRPVNTLPRTMNFVCAVEG